MDAMLRQAAAHFQAGRFPEAEKLYRQILALRPATPVVQANLGITLRHQGKLDEAAAAFRKAIALKPDYTAAHCNLGALLMDQGRIEDAIKSYRRALAITPNLVEAHFNLGSLFMQRGMIEEAAASFRLALAAAPGDAEIHCNLGAVLAAQGKLEEAADCFRRAIQAQPGFAEAHNNLGNVFKDQGKLADAEACYRKALSLKPAYAESHKHLGLVLCERDRIEEGLASLARHAGIVYGPGAPHRLRPAPPHKAQHDREQNAYLAGTQVSEQSPVDQPLRLADGSRVAGPAVNLDNDVGGIQRQWRHNRPQIVVIDQFLTGEALGKLRQFCWDSTIWRAIYDGGYLGAMPEHGFACPLLAQIANELRAAYPAIFGCHPLLHLWAFKYDSRLSGIKLHADFAAVNVNFWITPDEANLDPESGGIKVWDTAAPLDWDFAKYNSDNPAIRDFLAREKAKPVTVPYRANRAVIFDSDLFHETDKIAFKDGYLNRRINVTLLYGRREKSGAAPDKL